MNSFLLFVGGTAFGVTVTLTGLVFLGVNSEKLNLKGDA